MSGHWFKCLDISLCISLSGYWLSCSDIGLGFLLLAQVSGVQIFAHMSEYCFGCLDIIPAVLILSKYPDISSGVQI